MNNPGKPFILCIDDDRDLLSLVGRILRGKGYNVATTANGYQGLEAARNFGPDLILLDVMMSGMDGYEVCSKFLADPDTAYTPIIFLTALEDEKVRERAFSLGAVDFLKKPVVKEDLLEKVELHLRTNQRWKEMSHKGASWDEKVSPSEYLRFIDFLSQKRNLSSDQRAHLKRTGPARVYETTRLLEIGSGEMARFIAEFLNLTYLSSVDPKDVRLGVLPATFARSNLVVAVNESPSQKAFVLSNPFNWGLLDALKKIPGMGPNPRLLVAPPDCIYWIFERGSKEAVRVVPSLEEEKKTATPVGQKNPLPSQAEEETHPIVALSHDILHSAVSMRASDIHIEPKKDKTVVRLRIDGDMREFSTLDRNASVRLITRFKAIGGLDITERRKPQDGSVEVAVGVKTFRLRMATTSTPHGESLIIRLLDPETQPLSLQKLGMKDSQVAVMEDLANRSQGLILICGPSGSGKTTTVYSLLSQVNCVKRSLMSVEDPVEYRIPFANQQQVNEKGKVTFEALLKSSVRQDPDILFIGEVRDPLSSKIAMDFASTGHLTITTLHTSNATTAIFRLERLGISRGIMADAVIGIVAQKLFKKPCSHCKTKRPISPEERNLLLPFTDEIPSEIAHPVGCPQCGHTGYFGREGVFEIITFDHEISEMVRQGSTIAEIRRFIHERGGYLSIHHALEKLRNFTVPLKEIYEGVLLEEGKLKVRRGMGIQAKTPSPEERKIGFSILLVEDDPDMQKLINRYLENEGYDVTIAQDGVEALLRLGQKEVDLVLCDINIPHLDGFKVVEMITQKGIEAPVIFLTGSTELDDEEKGLGLGAVDYIRKPVSKQLLLLRVKRVLDNRRKENPRLSDQPPFPSIPDAVLREGK